MNAPSLPSLFCSHWTLSPTVLVPAAGGAALYLLAVRRAAGPWPERRTVTFLAGIGVLLIALQSGIDRYDDQILSDHMIQHLLLLVLAPPLLLGGRPLVLALRALSARRRRGLARGLDRIRRFTGPLPSLGLFAAVVVLTHLPSFYDATLRHAAVHDAEHALYIAAGLVMFSPLLDGDPAPRHRLDGISKLAYLIVAMMPMTLVGAYLNRHLTLVYAPYGPPGRALGISALNNQAQAGAIMWIGSGLIMTAVGLWSAVAGMVAEERRLRAREARAAGSLVTPRGSPPA